MELSGWDLEMAGFNIIESVQLQPITLVFEVLAVFGVSKHFPKEEAWKLLYNKNGFPLLFVAD